MTDDLIEIQTCTNWRGDGLAAYEMPQGGTRHRWHCLECGQKGPAEVDGAVCKWQASHHIDTRHDPSVVALQGTPEGRTS